VYKEELLMEIEKSPPPTVDNTEWTRSFLYFCNYKQAEDNAAMRRVFLEHAYKATILTDNSANPDGAYMRHMNSLGEPGSDERANSLIRMLQYNYPARHYSAGWEKNRESDIEFIKSNWLE